MQQLTVLQARVKNTIYLLGLGLTRCTVIERLWIPVLDLGENADKGAAEVLSIESERIWGRDQRYELANVRLQGCL